MKLLYLLPLFLALFLMAACTSGGDGDGLSDTVLQKGTKGLTIDFMSPEKKYETYEGSPVEIAVRIHNQGYQDITRGIVLPSFEQDVLTFQGWSDSYGGQELAMPFRLQGKSLSNADGDFQISTISFLPREIDDSKKLVDSRISVTACYPYRTVFSRPFCIDTDPLNMRIAEKSCKSSDLESSGQGAPVAIVSVKHRILPSGKGDSVGLEFTITAQNKAEGIISTPDSYESVCNGREFDPLKLNVISLDRVRLSGYRYEKGLLSDFDCFPNPLRETRAGFITTCKLKEESSIPRTRLSFETPLIIELSYGYKTTESVTLRIINREE